jgi:hypothetical protein
MSEMKNVNPTSADVPEKSTPDSSYESGKHLPTMPDPTQKDPTAIGDPVGDVVDRPIGNSKTIDGPERIERRRASYFLISS